MLSHSGQAKTMTAAITKREVLAEDEVYAGTVVQRTAVTMTMPQ